MNALRSVASGLAAILVGSLVVACSGGDGSGSGEPVWTSATSQGLACQSEEFYPNGVRPEGCPIVKPPPVVPVGPCPTGFTCSLAPTHTPAPLSGCLAPQVVTETALSGGKIAAEFMAAACPDNAATTAWIAAHPTFHASEASAVPGLPAPSAYSTYVEYMPPTPTAFPSSGGVDAGDSDTHQAPTNLPCTDFFKLPSTLHPYGFEAAYCVDVPSLETWVTVNYPNSSNEGWGAGPSVSVGDGLPDAAPGYVYLTLWSPDIVIIGGMCQRGCGVY